MIFLDSSDTIYYSKNNIDYHWFEERDLVLKKETCIYIRWRNDKSILWKKKKV